MIKKQTQIKINLNNTLKKIIKIKADSLGMTMAGYLKFTGLNWDIESTLGKKRGLKRKK